VASVPPVLPPLPAVQRTEDTAHDAALEAVAAVSGFPDSNVSPGSGRRKPQVPAESTEWPHYLCCQHLWHLSGEHPQAGLLNFDYFSLTRSSSSATPYIIISIQQAKWCDLSRSPAQAACVRRTVRRMACDMSRCASHHPLLRRAAQTVNQPLIIIVVTNPRVSHQRMLLADLGCQP
jgi:hypothetical protein